MIKKVSESDSFGYDDAGRPVTIKLTPDIYCFGYDVCHVLQTLMRHGCDPVPRLFADNSAFVFIYDPKSQKTELWSGQWSEDEKSIYSIVDPEQRGLVDQIFESVDAVREFAQSDLTELPLTPVKFRFHRPSDAGGDACR